VVVSSISYVDIPPAVESDAERIRKLAIARAAEACLTTRGAGFERARTILHSPSERLCKSAVSIEFVDALVAAVGHVKISAAVDGDPNGFVKLAVATTVNPCPATRGAGFERARAILHSPSKRLYKGTA